MGSVTQSMLSDTEPFFQTRLQYPGMSVLPLTTKFDPAAADIIYKKSERKTYVDYVNEIAKLLEPYNKTNHQVGDYVKKCNEPIDFTNEEKTKDKKFKSCLFDIDTLPTVCTDAEEDYGYKAGTPCIFVRLNKIINWKPVPFLDLNDLPTDQDKEFKMVCKVYARNLMDIMRINVGY